MKSLSIRLGALFGFLGVGLGAFGAHGLKDILSPYGVSIFEKAVLYHLIHAVALVALGGAAYGGALRPSIVSKVAILFSVGIVLFSGSLYLLAITELRWLGAITPVGGTAFIVGWFILARWGGSPERN